MAIDSEAKRRSVQGYSASPILPPADGEIDKSDRRRVAGLYAFSTEFLQDLSGSLAFGAVLTNRAILLVFAVLAADGALARVSGKLLAGVLVTAGALQRVVTTFLVSLLMSTGTLLRFTTHSLTGSLDAAAVLVRHAVISLIGTISQAGVVSRQAARMFDGLVTATSELAKLTAYRLAGSLDSLGVVIRHTAVRLVGVLMASGIVQYLKSFVRSFVASLGLDSSLVRHSARHISGALTEFGELTRQASRFLASALTISGGLSKRVGRLLSGVLSGGATLAFIFIYFVFLSAGLTITSTIRRLTGRTLTGSVDLTGSPVRHFARLLAGVFITSGSLARQTTRDLMAELPIVASLLALLSKNLAGVLTLDVQLIRSSSVVEIVSGLAVSLYSIIHKAVARLQQRHIAKSSYSVVGDRPRLENLLMTAVEKVDVGARVEVSVTFTVDGELVDPLVVTFLLKSPTGVLREYTLGNGVIRNSIGRYSVSIVVDEPGFWQYRWEGSNGCDAVDEGSIPVRRSHVL